MRLRKLEEVAERKAYNELVKDITPKRVRRSRFLLIKINLDLVSFIFYQLFA